MSTESTLKPCPFCGGKANHSAVRDGRVVFCRECGAQGPEQYHGPVGAKSALYRAIAAWNRRAAIEEVTGP